MARGLSGGASDVPVGGRPDGGVSRLRLHVRLLALLPVGRGERPRALRADSRAGRGRTSAGDRRLVGRAGLQHSLRRVVRASGSVRPALPPRQARRQSHDRRKPRLVRAQRDDPADPASNRHRLVRVPSPGPEGESRPARAALLVASRPTVRASSPTASRTSTALRRTTSASTSRRRSRRSHRTSAKQRSSSASATTAVGRRARTSTRSRA